MVLVKNNKAISQQENISRYSDALDGSMTMHYKR